METLEDLFEQAEKTVLRALPKSSALACAIALLSIPAALAQTPEPKQKAPTRLT